MLSAARDWATAALEIHVERAVPHRLLAEALVKLKEFDRAIERIRRRPRDRSGQSPAAIRRWPTLVQCTQRRRRKSVCRNSFAATRTIRRRPCWKAWRKNIRITGDEFLAGQHTMSISQHVRRFTPDEYYRLEAEADYRSEFYDGEIFAMAGGSARHSRICANILRHLGNKLEGTPCVPFGSDLKFRVKATGLRTYPDVSVYCGKRELDPDDPARQTYMNPTVLAEVLSPSTEQYDRGTKSVHYRRIESLKIILLVSQDEARVERTSGSPTEAGACGNTKAWNGASLGCNRRRVAAGRDISRRRFHERSMIVRRVGLLAVTDCTNLPARGADEQRGRECKKVVMALGPSEVNSCDIKTRG